MLNRFMEAYEKRHDTTDANVRNYQASIKNIETLLRQLMTLVNESSPPRNPKPQSQPHVMEIFNEEEAHFEPLMIHIIATIRPGQQLEEERIKAKGESCSYDSPYRGDLATTWSLGNTNSSPLNSYQPSLPFPS